MSSIQRLGRESPAVGTDNVMNLSVCIYVYDVHANYYWNR